MSIIESNRILRLFKHIHSITILCWHKIQKHKNFIFIIALLMPTGFSFLDHAQRQVTAPISDTQGNPHALYFNSHFLHNYPLVCQTLLTYEKFQEVYFPASDGIMLHGLYKEQPDAQATIIFCSGFYPGRKEGIATFIKMVPSHLNILFFDARGHGKSEGPFWSSLTNYGMHEYKDVIGALKWVHEKNNKPIIIHGLCAGAFHAAKALIHINKEDDNRNIKVKGLIFDSGVPSLVDATQIPLTHIRDKILPHWWQSWYCHDTKEAIKNRYLFHISWFILKTLLQPAQWYLHKKLKEKKPELTLHEKIHGIECPILFMHAENDTYSPYTLILSLANKARNQKIVTFQNSEHALNHLKHTKKYQDNLDIFIKSLLI